MTTRAVRVWDAFLVWLGMQSRHRCSLTATRVPGHTPRHAFTADNPERTGHQIAFTPRRNGKLIALTQHYGMTTTEAADLFRANLRPVPDTSRPRPGSLTEMGQKIADGLAPWTGRADDTIQLEPIRDEPHYGLIDYLDRYGSATKIGGTA